MSTIRLHLEDEEWEPLHRLAEELHVTPELIAYTAIDRLMQKSGDPIIREQIHRTGDWRRNNLAVWADPGRDIHAYEGM